MKEIKTKVFRFRLTEKEFEQLKKLAKENNTDASNYIRKKIFKKRR